MRYAEQVDFVDDLTQSEGKRDSFIKQCLGQSQDELAGWWRWPFLLTSYNLQTVAAYTTGTVDVTNGSRTLAGNSTVWTRAMVGRKFRLTTSSSIYRITGFTSTTSLTLDRPFGETTDTTEAYSIYKDEYLLAGDLDTSKIFVDPKEQLSGAMIHDQSFDLWDPANTSQGDLQYVILSGRTIVPFTSQIGTVSLTAGSRTLTGASTTWLTTPEGLTRGVALRIGNFIYHIKTIDSDSQITLYERNTSTSVSGSSDWEFLLHHLLMAQISPRPSDSRQLMYRGYHRCQPLVDDGDVSDIPEQWHWLMNMMAARIMFRYSGELSRFQAINAEIERGIQQMIVTTGRASSETRFRFRSSDDPGHLVDPVSTFLNTVTRLQ